MKLEGICKLIPICNPNRLNKEVYDENEDLMVDKTHKEKITLADAILVVDVAHYIGSSTKKEIIGFNQKKR